MHNPAQHKAGMVSLFPVLRFTSLIVLATSIAQSVKSALLTLTRLSPAITWIEESSGWSPGTASHAA
jgi:hypothetical protein